MASGCKLIEDCQKYNTQSQNIGLSNELIAKTVIQTFMLKQQWLFSGYMRMVISERVIKQTLIPLDVINLCQHFFNVNIEKESNTFIESLPELDKFKLGPFNTPVYKIYKFATNCYKQCECWIAFEILSSLSAFQPERICYYNDIGLVLDYWRVFDQAEKSFEIALKMKKESHIFRWNLGICLNRQRKYHLSVKLFESD